MRQVSSYMRNTLGTTNIEPNFDHACTIVASQLDAAVYICTNGIKCGAVNGINVADALDAMFGDGSCVTNANGVDYTGGVAWVNGPEVGPSSISCIANEAAFITMRKSGVARTKRSFVG